MELAPLSGAALAPYRCGVHLWAYCMTEMPQDACILWPGCPKATDAQLPSQTWPSGEPHVLLAGEEAQRSWKYFQCFHAFSSGSTVGIIASLLETYRLGSEYLVKWGKTVILNMFYYLQGFTRARILNSILRLWWPESNCWQRPLQLTLKFVSFLRSMLFRFNHVIVKRNYLIRLLYVCIFLQFADTIWYTLFVTCCWGNSAILSFRQLFESGHCSLTTLIGWKEKSLL